MLKLTYSHTYSHLYSHAYTPTHAHTDTAPLGSPVPSSERLCGQKELWETEGTGGTGPGLPPPLGAASSVWGEDAAQLG